MAIDSSTVIYTGYNLTNIGVDGADNLQEALQSINTTIGGITGIDWGSFDYNCLPGSITTASQFVDGITTYACNLNTTVNTFIGTTYVADKASLQSQINNIVDIGLTSCVSVGVVNTDTISQALSKILTNLCSINSAINPSSADWNNCYSVSPSPTTIVDAFNVILGQICDIKNNPPTLSLPTFDNVGSCLSTPSATDTLYDTVVKLRDLICTLPQFDINDVEWTTCIPNPNVGGGADILGTLNQMIAAIDAAYTRRVITFDPTFFTVTNASGSCGGKNVTLVSGIPDKMVALNGGDTSPNYLLSKMTPGTNMSFDTSTTPGTVILNNTSVDTKVKAQSTDSAAGYLMDKIEGSSDYDTTVTIGVNYNPSSQKAQIIPSVSFSLMASRIMDAISRDSSLMTQLCGLVCGCSPCTTTTTTTISGAGTIAYVITNVSTGGQNITIEVTGAQSSPTVAFFDSGTTTLIPNQVIATGSYPVTATTPVTGIVTLKNSDSSTLNYHMYVKDSGGSTVSGSSNLTNTVTASSTVTVNPFTYGTSASNYIVYIDIYKTAPTTTSTTTTTTTSA